MAMKCGSINVRGCQRCGCDHDELPVYHLTNPVDDFAFWTTCPIMSEPALIAQTSESTRTVGVVRGHHTTLGELQAGAIFITQDDILAVKTEYRTFNGGTQCDCYLLASGECAHFPFKDNTIVREVVINL